MEISEVTRRDIFDAIVVKEIYWAGRLDERDFLNRIYDLRKFKSFDPRFEDAEGDIWQHRINNFDWEDDWVFNDHRFDLESGDDQIFLRFLCETIHPVVRPNTKEAEKIRKVYNEYLKNDGFEIIEKTRISNKPVFIARKIGIQTPGLDAVKDSVTNIDTSGYVSQQITRMEASVNSDPGLAIGTAKELVETCCKTILQNKGLEVEKNWDISKLTKMTCKELKLTPDDIPGNAKASDTIKKLLSNLAMITQGLAELRNSYGTGHGKSANSKGLLSRHAKLAVGAASTLAVFLIETNSERT